MDEIDSIVWTDLEEELAPSDNVGHTYVVCNRCFHKEKPGSMIVTLCGELKRLTSQRLPKRCKACAAVKSGIVPALVHCTFCGFIGA